MKGFIVTAITKEGTDALDRCIQDEKVELSKQSLIDRLKFHTIWIRKTSRNPLRDEWMVHPDAERILALDKDFSIERCVSEVDNAMVLNGAQRDIDYSVEVYDG